MGGMLEKGREALRMSGRIYARRAWRALRDLGQGPVDLLREDVDFAEPLTDEERAAAASIDTVCLPLGPYRNLTTVTAAIFAFHRHAFVLNHAGTRVLKDPSLDIFAPDGAANWPRFAAAAVRLAKLGGRGNHGGSILHSHAFDRGRMREAFDRRFDGELVPPAPKTLFWKESMVLANRLRDTGYDFAAARDFPAALRFIVPMRDPIDCAQSSIRTGHYVYLSKGYLIGKMHVLRRILDFYAWISRRVEANPDLFFILHERDLGRASLEALERFARLPDDPGWADTVLAEIAFDKHYVHPEAQWAEYERVVRGEIGADTRIGRALLQFLPSRAIVA